MSRWRDHLPIFTKSCFKKMINNDRQDTRSNQSLQFFYERINGQNVAMGPNDSINQFFYDRLMLFAEDHNADVMLYSVLLQHLQGSEIPDHDFMEILVLRDSGTGEPIFPSKETAFQHLQQRIQYHTRARDEFLRLTQIIHRVAVVQGWPVDVGPEILPNIQQQAQEPEAEEPEVEAEAQEVVTVGSGSNATFDMQPEHQWYIKL